MEKDLTVGSPFRVLLRFSLPVIGGNVFQLLYTMADTMIVGRTLGEDALAAVGSTTIIIYFVLCFIQGFTGGFGICLAQRRGARDEAGQRACAAVSWLLSGAFALALMAVFCSLAEPILSWMQTPDNIRAQAYDYLIVVLAGTGATVFYNMISNMMCSLGDSRTPLVFLVFSALLNIVLDLALILKLSMGVAGAAWATVVSQLASAALCTVVGMRKFDVLRMRRDAFSDWQATAGALLRVGLPMGFQMSVMCIGQLAMQSAVNAIGSTAVAGYTAATKADQLSVLIDNAFGIALAGFVAQNFGAGKFGRIRAGIRACLIQIQSCNVIMCALLLGLRGLIVPLFLSEPSAEVIGYSSAYLFCVSPFYLLLGLVMVYRTAVQSMGNSRAPFLACIAELVMRIAGTFVLSALLARFELRYEGVCLAHPLAWAGSSAVLIPVYYKMLKKQKTKAVSGA